MTRTSGLTLIRFSVLANAACNHITNCQQHASAHYPLSAPTGAVSKAIANVSVTLSPLNDGLAGVRSLSTASTRTPQNLPAVQRQHECSWRTHILLFTFTNLLPHPEVKILSSGSLKSSILQTQFGTLACLLSYDWNGRTPHLCALRSTPPDTVKAPPPTQPTPRVFTRITTHCPTESDALRRVASKATTVTVQDRPVIHKMVN